MGIQVALHHRTQYQYGKAISLGPQIIQLRPAPHCKTPILSYSLNVTPADHILNWQFDPLGNHLARVIIPNKADEFVVVVELVADLTPYNPFAFFLEPRFENYPFEYLPEVAKNLEPYRLAEPPGPLLRAFVESLSVGKQGTVSFLAGVNQRVRDKVGYVTRFEQGVQTCEQTLSSRTG